MNASYLLGRLYAELTYLDIREALADLHVYLDDMQRKLNDALGGTSILVTHDVIESLQIVDYLYFISDGRIVGQGTPDEIRASTVPYVKQFVYSEMDGPVPFHYPAKRYEDELGLSPSTAAKS